MPSTRFWGKAPQQEFTARRLCPGFIRSARIEHPRGVGGEQGIAEIIDVPPHASRWWRFVDPRRRDGWHCCACESVFPEVSPIDGSVVAEPALGLARTVTPRAIAA